MTTKQYLTSYRSMKGIYNAIIEEYKSVESDIVSLKSPSLGDRIQSSPKNDPIGEIVCRLEDKRGKIGLKMVEYNAKLMLIENQDRKSVV